MTASENVQEIHVVCNTHWDREFRETFEVTRRGLLDMMDITLDLLDRDDRYTSYTLDAHCILVEDYLEMRPQRREQIKKLLHERRLFLGPWYSLPDAMNAGGEALVRNLLRGRQVARSLGTECMKAGYTPNNWGQPSQMPQILRGFGIDSALIYRGISPHECPSEFIWEGADGSEIFGHRFAKLARYNWYYLVFRPVAHSVEPTDKKRLLHETKEKPFRIADGRSRATSNFRLLEPAAKMDAGRIADAVQAMLELEGPDSSTGLFLAMHGHDMSVAHPFDPEIVEAAAANFGGACQIQISNLEDFIARMRERLDNSKAVRLTGERRMNLKEGFWTYLLPSTVSARTYLKVINTLAENLLAGEAEPLCCLAAALGADYPRRYLDRSWQFLLGNHTHDANAGCAPDRVCLDMEYRYRQSMDTAGICSEDAMKYVAARLDGRKLTSGEAMLTVFNPAASPADGGVLAAEVALPRGVSGDHLQIVDEHGVAIPYQLRNARDDSLFVDNHWDVPTFTEVRRFSVFLKPSSVPALGYATHTVRCVDLAPASDPLLASSSTEMENAFLRLRMQPNGSIDLVHKPTGRSFKGLNGYRDQGEAGNAWQQELPANDEIVETCSATAHLELVENGPLAATICATTTMDLPEASIDDARRSDRRIPFTIATWYTLYADDPRVHVRVSFDNTVRDHWLRAVFPTDIQTTVVHADTHFDVVERWIAHPDDTGWIERYRGTAPMHQMVDLSDSNGGIALLTCGLFEYEVLDDEARTLLLSLVRSFPIKLQVSEEKTEILPDTGSQCPGLQSFEYAIMPHAGNYVEGDVLRWAQRFNNPPRVVQVTPSEGELEASFSLLNVAGAGIVVTAVKQAEESGATLIRLFNCDKQQREAKLMFGCNVTALERAELDETVRERLAVSGRTIQMVIPPKKIVTLLARFATS